MTKAISTSLLAAVLSCPAFAQTADPSESSAAIQQRHTAYLKLNRQIYARRGDPDSGQLNGSNEGVALATKQLEEMMAKEIDMALAAPNPSASNISSAIRNLQGDITLSAWDPETTNTPFANFFSLNGIQTAAIAYVLMQGGEGTPDTLPFLKFYDKISSSWQEKAAAPTALDFEGSGFSVARLNSGTSSESWFLAWGPILGSTQGVKRMRLYSFDGSSVHTIWRRDLRAGKISVTPDSITLDYVGEENLSVEKHEVFHVTPNGPQLFNESSKQW